ncbi:MAG: YkgJ family cysteine cluster protein, partial [Planctomycetota bacterium]
MNRDTDNPCENCGICCLAFSLPPFDANEHVRAPEELMEEVEAYRTSPRHRESSPCLWLELGSGRCVHHEVRPNLCRWFEPGGKACNELRAKAGLSKLDTGGNPEENREDPELSETLDFGRLKVRLESKKTPRGRPYLHAMFEGDYYDGLEQGESGTITELFEDRL